MIRAAVSMFFIGLLSTTCVEAVTWRVVYPQAIDETDHRNDYPLALLNIALAKTGVSYQLIPSSRVMVQGKALRQLKENRDVNLVWSMTDSQREKDLLAIRIPITKGLIGWRVFIIHQDNLAVFSRINSRQQLLAKVPVQGEEWPDTKVLQTNGFNVSTIPDYTDAFPLLMSRKADFFPRSVIEVMQELDVLGDGAELVLEPSLAIHYPTALYFFVNKQDRNLAHLIQTGLERAIADGDFDAVFNRYFAEVLAKLNIQQRAVMSLNNPSLPADTPLDNANYWYRPTQVNELP